MVVELDQWESIALFIQIVSWFEGKEETPVDRFLDPGFLLESLEKYTEQQYYLKLSETVFGTKLTDKGKVVVRKPRIFYEFVTGIRNEKPYVWSYEDLKVFSEKIKNKNILQNRKSRAKKFSISDRRMEFMETSWILYFPDLISKAEDNNGLFTFGGISKGLIFFSYLGKVTLSVFRPKLQKIVKYVGKYDLFGANDKYLLVKVNADKDKNEIVQLIFYIGDLRRTRKIGNIDDIETFEPPPNAVIEKVDKFYTKEFDPNFYSMEQLDRNITGEIPTSVVQFFRSYKIHSITSDNKVLRKNEGSGTPSKSRPSLSRSYFYYRNADQTPALTDFMRLIKFFDDSTSPKFFLKD